MKKIILFVLVFFIPASVSALTLVSDETTTAFSSSMAVLYNGTNWAGWEGWSNASVFSAKGSGTARYAAITFNHTHSGTIYVRAFDTTNIYNWELVFSGSAPASDSESYSTIPFVLTSESDVIAGHYFFVLTCYDPTFETCNIFGNNSGEATQYIGGGTGGWSTSIFTGIIATGEHQSFGNEKPAVVLSFIHPDWTADLDGILGGAKWIWATDGPTIPKETQTYLFEKTFSLSGPVTDATLYLAVDEHAEEITLNGNTLIPRVGFTKDTEETYVIPPSYFLIGENKLSIIAVNDGGSDNPMANPAGILYKLIIDENEPVITLENPTETEDDELIDGKGVADKTNFTFSIQATNANEVMLWTNDGTETKSYPLVSSGDSYVFTKTFPKGVYGYHFEANAGAVRFPETGELKFTTGYSNVAFLPGIKASRLFKQKPSGCLINCEDQLWEPNWWTDTNELMMNPDGTSENENIYTKTDEYIGTIDQANVLPWDLLRENFYVSFLDSMNKMKKNGDIENWKALPYDWRLAFPNILSGGNATVSEKIFYDNRYATDTPYILQEIRALAQSSDTGKVTIIGHSMGGMLAKKLLIDNQDISNFTDTLILVDSPQLGTPQAIATMLHGTNENIPNNFGFFSDAETGRKVAQNMPSVYTLLPSKAYTERVKDEGKNYTTLISQDISLQNFSDLLWNTDSVLNYYRTNYATTNIISYNALTDFLIGNDGHLSAPDDDIIHPKSIRPDMLAEAQAIHDEIDTWVPPEKMRVVQIAGWGIPETIKSITYKGKKCFLCSSYSFDVEPVFTFDGDGTVILPSQMAMETETYFVDLNGYNNQIGNEDINFKKNRSHGSVLEVKDVRSLIENVIIEKNYPADGLTFIKTNISELNPSIIRPLLRLSLHSPVKVDVTDNDGNHLGISEHSTVEKIVYDTEMSNSYYLEMGEGKYLGFPLGVGTTIKLQGTGTGTFTLNLEQYQGDAKEGSQTFTDIPVSETTKATLVLNMLDDAKELALDQNGDGIIDSVVFTDENKETITFQTLKNEILKLSNIQPSLLNQAETAEKQFNKGNYKSTNALLFVLQKEVVKLSPTKIQKTEASRLSAIIEVLIKSSEENIL